MADYASPGSGGLSGVAEGHLSRRAGLVQKAATDWKNALVDLGGRNNLLHYRDLKRGTLDLTAADRDAVSGLLLGKATRVSALFGDPEQRDQVLRRVRTIHNKAKENFEERGLETLFDRVRPGDVGEQAGGLGAVCAGPCFRLPRCVLSARRKMSSSLPWSGRRWRSTRLCCTC